MQTQTASSFERRGSSRRRCLFALVLVLAVVAAACGTDDTATEETAAPDTDDIDTDGVDTDGADADEIESDCPFPEGVVRGFTTIDLAGTSGDLGLGTGRAAEISVDLVNANGGILGCELELDIVDEGFPDVDVCLRRYREALGERDQYAFFFGPTGSGCMAAVTELTNAAGMPIIANQAADHLPFFDPQFQRLNFHAAVSTFLEGRAIAKFGADKGWERVSILAPNYAYGLDIAAAFKAYFEEIVPGGEVIAEQNPEFDERNFAPFIGPVVSGQPDAVVSAFFAGFVIPFWQQWAAGGHDDIPSVGGLIDTPGWELVDSADQIPDNAYQYSRGAWQVVSATPTGQQFHDAYIEVHGDSDHPVPLAWGQAFWSGVLMVKALVEMTESLDADDWVALVQSGEFTFPSPYHVDQTAVNPINHMADTCAQVGRVTFDESLPVPASFDLSDTQNICMSDVLEPDEARGLTTNPGVSDQAVAAYEERAEESRQADAQVPQLGR
jgi:branched-chain amino acid transport system substrate-binding protein